MDIAPARPKFPSRTFLIGHFLVACSWPLPGQDLDVRKPLARGDTAAVIETLRALVQEKHADSETRCLLATLLTQTATSRREDWQQRAEARDLFDQALESDPDPTCLLQLSVLMEKQGITLDAARIAKRALGMFADQPELASPDVLAEVYYRRAIRLADWVRNFDRLVAVTDLPVSTPGCSDTGAFCESVLHPANFLEKLERAVPLADLVADERRALRGVLDSALQYEPAHPGALRLALREAAVAEDWEDFARRAAAAHRARPDDANALLAVLTGAVRLGRLEVASRVFDTLMTHLGPEALARYEGMALIADTSLQQRLQDTQQVVYADVVWGLSDPLYLSEVNERRMEHYARVYLADVLFSDPAAEVAGRDTEQGRLLIRYGMPVYWYDVRADKRLELTPAQRQERSEILGCATKPKDDNEVCLATTPSAGGALDGGGRWSFWFYHRRAPPLIFERGLGNRIARHKFETRSRELDSLMARALPSSYDPPFEPVEVRALVTRLPRPHNPVVEVHAGLRWPAADLIDSVTLGFFLHDATSGKKLLAGRTARRSRSPAAFETTLPARGTIRLSIEGWIPARNLAAQRRVPITLTPSDPGRLGISDLLLGDSLRTTTVVHKREQVRLDPRADSIYATGAPMALYWEVYGLKADSNGTVPYAVRVQLQDITGRDITARLWRGLREALGARLDRDQSLVWEVDRELFPEATYAPDAVMLRLPEESGTYRVTVTVTEHGSGQSAAAGRVIEVDREVAGRGR